MTTRQEQEAQDPAWVGVKLVSTVVRRFREPTACSARNDEFMDQGFYIHATAFALVNITLFALNVLVGGAWWFYRPLLGWGMGLEIHALGVRLRRQRTVGSGMGVTQVPSIDHANR
jgi:2TM domain